MCVPAGEILAAALRATVAAGHVVAFERGQDVGRQARERRGRWPIRHGGHGSVRVEQVDTLMVLSRDGKLDGPGTRVGARWTLLPPPPPPMGQFIEIGPFRPAPGARAAPFAPVGAPPGAG